MNVLISRNVLDGVSVPFEVSEQVTVYAYGLEPGRDVTVAVAGPDEPGPVFQLEEKGAAAW